MGRKRTSGLTKRGGIWHVDKQINGRRVCQSCGTDKLEEAEHFLARLIESSRQASVYGVRPKRTFDRAAAKFVRENQHKRSLDSDISRLRTLMPWIGDLTLDKVHMGTLQPWIDYRKNQGVKAATRTVCSGTCLVIWRTWRCLRLTPVVVIVKYAIFDGVGKWQCRKWRPRYSLSRVSS